MKVFVDTNVLIDFVCNRNEFYDAAESVFALGLSGNIDICISDISFINTLYVGKKYNFTQEELCNCLRRILEFCKISEMNDLVVANALSSAWKDKEDATQYYSAKASLADVIVTRNIKDYSLADINVMTPTELCTQFQ